MLRASNNMVTIISAEKVPPASWYLDYLAGLPTILELETGVVVPRVLTLGSYQLHLVEQQFLVRQLDFKRGFWELRFRDKFSMVQMARFYLSQPKVPS